MQLLSLIPECTIAVSLKSDGAIKSFEEADRLFRNLSNLQSLPVVFPTHEHSTRVKRIDQKNVLEQDFPADVLLTNERHIVLAHSFADCVPLIFIDRKRRAVGFAHAGWKGLVQNIISITLLNMELAYGTKPDDLWVWIGPCIQKANYRSDEEPAQANLPGWEGKIDKVGKEYFIDLPGFVLSECERLGLDPTRVINDGRDTFSESETLFSFRRYKETKKASDKGNFVVSCWLEK